MSFLLDPPLLVASGAVTERLLGDEPAGARAAVRTATVAAFVARLGRALRQRRPLVRAWPTLGARSGREFMLTSGLAEVDESSIGPARHARARCRCSPSTRSGSGSARRSPGPSRVGARRRRRGAAAAEAGGPPPERVAAVGRQLIEAMPGPNQAGVAAALVSSRASASPATAAPWAGSRTSAARRCSRRSPAPARAAPPRSTR